jgi:hypothetical protein
MARHYLKSAQQQLVISLNYHTSKLWRTAKNAGLWENTAVYPNEHCDWLQAGWLRIDSRQRLST